MLTTISGTTTGMVVACLVASTATWDKSADILPIPEEDSALEVYDSMDGPSEEEAYLQGEYKTILQLVAVMSHGKIAKRLTDYAIDLMQDVQNLRKAVYEYVWQGLSRACPTHVMVQLQAQGGRMRERQLQATQVIESWH